MKTQDCNIATGKPEIRRSQKDGNANTQSRPTAAAAKEAALSILPVSRRVAEIVISENRDIAKAVIADLLGSRQVAERVCRHSGQPMLVDRRQSYRSLVTSPRQVRHA